MYDRARPFAARVRWAKKETRDTSTFALWIEDEAIRRQYTFSPGQFNMLSVPGIGEAAISISSGPEDGPLLHTIRVAGNVTSAISGICASNIVGMRGPFGNGWPMQEVEGKRLIVIAGGLGMAPLRPVVRHLIKSGMGHGTDERPVLIYGARSPRDILFRHEFQSFGRLFDVHITVDKADPHEHWKGRTGLIPPILEEIPLHGPGTIAFLCGPEVMMKCLINEFMLRGMPAEQIFLSLERNMNCAMGTCGHCMFGPKFVCKDGPVFRYSEVRQFMAVQEI
ncbi:MAG: FAD/NAD(P)-binding protein [Nitrospiraceae bacterium]|nr:FAD/NAD(P)-binding protein [Nitrospiraceae bacterium]